MAHGLPESTLDGPASLVGDEVLGLREHPCRGAEEGLHVATCGCLMGGVVGVPGEEALDLEDSEAGSGGEVGSALLGDLREPGAEEIRGLPGEVGAACCNSLLFPVLFARRTLDRLLHREGSDVGFLPPPLEWAFKQALLAEAALVRAGLSFPIGASVVALARKEG